MVEWKLLAREKDLQTNGKTKSAEIFYAFKKLAMENADYLRMRSRARENLKKGVNKGTPINV